MLGFIAGFFAAASLNAFLTFAGIAFLNAAFGHYKSPGVVLAASVGLWQWLYLGPMVWGARRAGKKGFSYGLIAAGAVALLLISPCFGLIGMESVQRERWERHFVRTVEDPKATAADITTALDDHSDFSRPVWGGRDGVPRAPLELAVASRNLVAAQVLLDHGAYVDEKVFDPKDGQHHILLYFAIQICEPRIAELLIARGAAKTFTPHELEELARIDEHCKGVANASAANASLTAIFKTLVPEAAKP